MNLFDTAIIIAGGKSSRMGFDKAFMKINGTPCIELIIKKLKKHFDEIIIVARESAKYDKLGEIITFDELKGAGPIAGLHAGLKISSSMYCYLLACDMPVISDDLIVYMKNQIKSWPDIVACYNVDFIEPFHAVYSKNLISLIEQQVNLGKRSLYNLMQNCRTEVLSDNMVKKLSAGLPIFTNLNTCNELDEIQALKYL